MKVLRDTLTVRFQLEALTEKAIKILERENGPIIPKQSKAELLALYERVILGH